MASLVLGLDVGTTGTKAVLADPVEGGLAQAMAFELAPDARFTAGEALAVNGGAFTD